MAPTDPKKLTPREAREIISDFSMEFVAPRNDIFRARLGQGDKGIELIVSVPDPSTIDLPQVFRGLPIRTEVGRPGHTLTSGDVSVKEMVGHAASSNRSKETKRAMREAMVSSGRRPPDA